MAELADALDLGSSAVRRAGSSPVPGTSFRGPSAPARFRQRTPRSSPYGDELTPAKRLKFKSCSRHQQISRFSPTRIAVDSCWSFMGGAALQRCVLIPDLRSALAAGGTSGWSPPAQNPTRVAALKRCSTHTIFMVG